MNLRYCLNDKEPDGSPCWTVPAEFVRPRFFFGQRLGVVDLCDWLWYHGGKQRFHNLQGHGVGVLCGLQAERYLTPEHDRTTVLRVKRGAALDGCGREIVVGVDQCIDVAAWYLQNRECPAVVEWRASEDRRLCIGLRYLECPSDPAPAPRDPCGCEAGGCDYSRVREGFELRLFTPAQMAALGQSMSGPAAAGLVRSCGPGEAAADPEAELMRAAHALAGAPCLETPASPWLWLACLEVMWEAEQVVDIQGVDNVIPARRSLLATSVLQGLVILLAAVGEREEYLGPGPCYGALSFTGSGADAGEMQVAIDLVTEPAGGGVIPLVGATVRPEFCQLRRLDAAQGWVDTPPDGVTYNPAPTPHLAITWSAGLQEGQYRLTISPPAETPMVDERLRPLRPLRLARSFRLADEAGTLVLAPTLMEGD